MTEIKQCPTCGIKCTKQEAHMSDWQFTYKPLPPDLTKLREILDEYNPDNDDPDRPTMWWDTYRKFYQAVKELLEQEEEKS